MIGFRVSSFSQVLEASDLLIGSRASQLQPHDFINLSNSELETPESRSIRGVVVQALLATPILGAKDFEGLRRLESKGLGFKGV